MVGPVAIVTHTVQTVFSPTLRVEIIMSVHACKPEQEPCFQTIHALTRAYLENWGRGEEGSRGGRRWALSPLLGILYKTDYHQAFATCPERAIIDTTCMHAGHSTGHAPNTLHILTFAEHEVGNNSLA